MRATLQTQSAEGWCFQRGKLQNQMSNEATDGFAPSVLDSFSGAVREAPHDFPSAVSRTSVEKTRVRTRILLPSPGAHAREHTTGVKSRALVFRGKYIADPQLCNKATDRLAPWGFDILRAHLDRILAFSINEERRRSEARDRWFEFESYSRRLFPWRRTLQAQIPTGVLILLSNTPQSSVVAAASHLHRGPPPRLSQTTCHIVARSRI